MSEILMTTNVDPPYFSFYSWKGMVDHCLNEIFFFFKVSHSYFILSFLPTDFSLSTFDFILIHFPTLLSHAIFSFYFSQSSFGSTFSFSLIKFFNCSSSRQFSLRLHASLVFLYSLHFFTGLSLSFPNINWTLRVY